VVHGDLSLSNLLVTPEGRVALLDWDETKVDVSLFDEAALPDYEEGPGRIRGQRALLAWEVAVSWHVEPEYAGRLAAELLSGRAHGWT
jgi:aminoglycoside phosphotransferase (APT) family kinase protein